MTTARPSVLVVHGPNLNLLGQREPDVYGTATLNDIDTELSSLAATLGLRWTEAFQSNHEGVLVDRLQACLQAGTSGLLINPAGLTHTSVVLRDVVAALIGCGVKVVEVHLSRPEAREPFRHHSFLADIVHGRVSGFGRRSYTLGLRGLADLLLSSA